jgi:transmembrane sensor
MMRWPFVGRRERLRREASDWIARLNGSHDQRDRAEFEQWYRANPDHAATYDRVSALFSAAEHVRPAPSAAAVRSAPARGVPRQRSRYALAAFAAAGIVVFLGYSVLHEREAARSAQGGVQVAVFTATLDESRLVALVDGSKVLLSPGSELGVDIDGNGRRLELRRGEGRFTVAHEARPFVVAAEGTEVVARGTQFVVSLTPDGTLVSLIEGRVEVSYVSGTDGGNRHVAGLVPGQRLIVPAASPTAPAAYSAAMGAAAPAMIELDDMRLAEALELVNRQADRKVGLADPTLADLRVTGAFRAGDIDGFAQGIAAALDLTVKRGADGTLWLGRRDRPRS